MCADEWNTTHRIPIWAVNDGLVGGNPNTLDTDSTVYVDIRTGETGNPPRWAEITLPTQEVSVCPCKSHILSCYLQNKWMDG